MENSVTFEKRPHAQYKETRKKHKNRVGMGRRKKAFKEFENLQVGGESFFIRADNETLWTVRNWAYQFNSLFLKNTPYKLDPSPVWEGQYMFISKIRT